MKRIAHELQALLAEAERLRQVYPDTAAFLDAVVQAISARELGETMPGTMNPKSAATLADEWLRQASSGRTETANLLYRALLIATSRRIASGEFENKSLDEFRQHLERMSKEGLEAFHEQILLDLHTLKQAKLKDKATAFSPGFKMSEPKLIGVSDLCRQLGSAKTYLAGGGEAV